MIIMRFINIIINTIKIMFTIIISIIAIMFTISIIIIIMVMSRMTIEKTVDTQGEEKWSVAEVETQWIRLGEQFDHDV